MQWLIAVSIPADGTVVRFPIEFSTTNYAIADSRWGNNPSDTTGHVDKYTYGFSVNPVNGHVTDFICIGY